MRRTTDSATSRATAGGALDPDGIEKSRMYPDKCKKRAEDFLLEVESSKRQGKYVDPRAGRIEFRSRPRTGSRDSRQTERWYLRCPKVARSGVFPCRLACLRPRAHMSGHSRLQRSHCPGVS